MDSLMHYGRKGMKWGVVNGPPYPLKPGVLKSTSLNDLQSIVSRMRVESEYVKLAKDINRMTRSDGILKRSLSYGLESAGKQTSKWAIGSILNRAFGQEVVKLSKADKKDKD